ncbi:MAG: hypothetical protein KDH89_21315, partial [Anaerolineae bacterium]|nr:hypothetical protein [Anaerolineae bacterium]
MKRSRKAFFQIAVYRQIQRRIVRGRREQCSGSTAQNSRKAIFQIAMPAFAEPSPYCARPAGVLLWFDSAEQFGKLFY